MNTIASILKECSGRGITLKPVGSHNLQYAGPREAIDERLLDTLRRHKGQLIQVLTVLETFEGRIVETSTSIH